MSFLYHIPRDYIIALANANKIHYSFSYAFVVNGLLCAFIIGPLLGGRTECLLSERDLVTCL